MVCCGSGTTLDFTDFLFCTVFGIELFAVGFNCFVLTSIGCSMVAGVVMGIDGWHKKGPFLHFLYG